MTQVSFNGDIVPFIKKLSFGEILYRKKDWALGKVNY